MKPLLRKNLQAVLMLALTAGSLDMAMAGTNYYRWIDEQGNTIHSDRPPPTGVDYDVVRTGAGFKKPGESDEAEESAEGDSGAPGDANAIAKSQKDPELCARARDNLDALTNSDRVTMRNEKGEVHVLTAEEIKSNILTTRGQIEAFCE